MALNETERRVLLAFPLDIKGDVAFIVDKLQNSLSEETSYSVWGPFKGKLVKNTT